MWYIISGIIGFLLCGWLWYYVEKPKKSDGENPFGY